MKVAARSSALSRAQVREVEELLGVRFEATFVQTVGDIDLKTSLRSLGKTDFFTREVDELVLRGKCQIAVHSAKDLPESLPEGLKVIALTRGQDPSDSLVFRENEFLDTLRGGAIIATSSERREEAVRSLRADFVFCDVRGTIESRLQGLIERNYDGVVVAEAALLRLNLGHLNRIRVPGKTAEGQGQLAIVAKEGDKEASKIFAPLDSRNYPKALYFGAEWPKAMFQDRQIIHHPLIQCRFNPLPERFSLSEFTHLIFTSKTAIRGFIEGLRRKGIPFEKKPALAVGKGTAKTLSDYRFQEIMIAEEETAEGILPLLERLEKGSCCFFPHSSLSRDVIQKGLKERNIPFREHVMYETGPLHNPPPSFTGVDEIIFSSPSTVNAFFSYPCDIPANIKLKAIGSITLESLQKKRSLL